MNTRKIFEKISTLILESLARTFPVACASDEFYFFPHIASHEGTTFPWDDFSAGSIRGMIHEISNSLSELDKLKILNDDTDIQAEKEIRTERNMLILFLGNLKDQLDDLALWKTQPSFYLTLMNAGLAQTLNQKNNTLFQLRIRELPSFLEQAVQNIEKIPDPWKEISLTMILNCREFLNSFTLDDRYAKLSFEALKSLEKKIKQLPSETRLDIPADLLKKIYRNHLATGLEISQISKILEKEIEEMSQIMFSEGEKIFSRTLNKSVKPRVLIDQVYDTISSYSGMKKDSVKMFRDELDLIRNHLIDTGIIEDNPRYLNPVRIEEMPSYFNAIRSASSYSIYPKHPPVGGTFYVLNASGYGIPSENYTEYRMLTAHETYPGHHLLDSSRLSLDNMVRRSLEFPLFYEGWACFAEMLLSFSGYFSKPLDRFILAKRRYWRAVRGQADIGLQTGKLDFESAANVLQEAGIPYQRAITSAKIYTLNPGYQVCYTVGIRLFLDLYNRYEKMNLIRFIKTVLSDGEVLFSDLEKLLKDFDS
jgi:hypothetical protein